MDLGYARVSTTKEDLDRQVDALTAAGVAPERIWLDETTGSTGDRPGLGALLAHADPGDVIVVHTLDRLGRTIRDVLDLVGDLTDRSIGLRTLADPITVDTTDPADPMGQLAAGLLRLLGQMERTYTAERAAHARAVATATGRRTGRPSQVDPDKLAYAAHLRDQGVTITDIVAQTGITRATLYRHLPPRTTQPRPTPSRTAAGLAAVPEQITIPLPEPDTEPTQPDSELRQDPEPAPQPAPEVPVVPEVRLLGPARRGRELLETITWPAGYSPTCPACTQPTNRAGRALRPHPRRRRTRCRRPRPTLRLPHRRPRRHPAIRRRARRRRRAHLKPAVTSRGRSPDSVGWSVGRVVRLDDR